MFPFKVRHGRLYLGEDDTIYLERADNGGSDDIKVVIGADHYLLDQWPSSQREKKGEYSYRREKDMPEQVTFEDAIEIFRMASSQEESVKNVLILLGKDARPVNLRKIALAWPVVRVANKGGGRKYNSELPLPDLWDQIWQNVVIDYDVLRRISRTGSECETYVEILRGYRLIYPDGSLCLAAQKGLRKMARDELGL